MPHGIGPRIGDVWSHCQGGHWTVVDIVSHFGSGRDYVVCEAGSERRIWPLDTWNHLVPDHDPSAPAGAMIRPFQLVRQALLRTPGAVAG